MCCPSTTNEKPKRSVRFSETEDIKHIDNTADLTREDHEKIWFTQSDFGHFKKTRRLIAGQTRKSGFGVILADAYNNLHSSCSQENLTRWCRFAHSRRGLEFSSNTEHMAQRNKSITKSIYAVLHFQKLSEATSGIVDHHRLAQMYKIYTEDSKKFAYLMGKADEAAARCTWHFDAPEENQKAINNIATPPPTPMKGTLEKFGKFASGLRPTCSLGSSRGMLVEFPKAA